MDYQGTVNQDQAQLNSLASQLAGLNSSYVDPTTYYNNSLNSLGGSDALSRVNTLKTALSNNENLITGLPANVGQRVQNADVTEGQKGRLVAMEMQPLQATETTLGQQGDAAQTNYNNILTQAQQAAGQYQTGFTTKQGALQSQIDTAQKALEDANQALQSYTASQQQAASSGGGGGGGGGSSQASSVNPSQEFLSYISSQFKAAGKNPSRQTQDSWANAWFAQHSVPVSARNAYWNLYNTTYNRPADPTKDWLYAK